MATAHLTVSIQHYSSTGVRVKFLSIQHYYFFLEGEKFQLVDYKKIASIQLFFIYTTVTKNISWLYPAQLVLGEFEDTLNTAPLYLNFFLQNPALQISKAAMMLDQAYSLAPGESLQKIRSLMALRVFLFDIRKPWSALAVGELQASSDMHTLRDRYAANQ